MKEKELLDIIKNVDNLCRICYNLCRFVLKHYDKGQIGG